MHESINPHPTTTILFNDIVVGDAHDAMHVSNAVADDDREVRIRGYLDFRNVVSKDLIRSSVIDGPCLDVQFFKDFAVGHRAIVVWLLPNLHCPVRAIMLEEKLIDDEQRMAVAEMHLSMLPQAAAICGNYFTDRYRVEHGDEIAYRDAVMEILRERGVKSEGEIRAMVPV